MTNTPRSVARLIDNLRTLEGAGFPVRRPFPTPDLSHFDPFLLIDEAGPMQVPKGGPGVGAPTHPHRGFETVSYVLSGTQRHKDSRGHQGKLNPGDVQWMTAGSGVLHDEVPDESFIAQGGVAHGFQIWVNLPGSHKMMEPRYQELPKARIPTGRSEDGKVEVKVIAGEALGATAAIQTVTPILYLHFTLQPGGKIRQPTPKSYNTLAQIFGGHGRFGPDRVVAGDGQTVLFAADGDSVLIENDGQEPLDLLLLGGEPINEPVARYGPFVMNTEAELRQAVRDFQLGKFGAIPA